MYVCIYNCWCAVCDALYIACGAWACSCMRVFKCKYTWVCARVGSVFTCVRLCMRVCTCVCVSCVPMCLSAEVCESAQVCDARNVCMRVCVYVDMCVCKYVGMRVWGYVYDCTSV